MRSCSKRNKSKVWRKTYGKVFLRKRSMMMMHAAVNASIASVNMSAISESFGNSAVKAVAMAEVAIRSVEVMAKTISISNNGFATRLNKE